VDGRWLRAGRHYPRSTGEFQSWFTTDADCLDYLEWLRWPDGFVCPRCGHAGGWALGDARYKCAACGARTAVTAGTLFDRRRTPLTVWFTACWMFAAQKDGVSALSLQRALEIGSYPTAWAMLHRLRSVLVRSGRDRLTGIVEVDETYIGGDEPGLRGGRARGKKSLVGVAVEVTQPRGYGRCRIAILADASAASLHPFVTENVEPGSTVITDGWQGYRGIDKLGYTHDRRSQRAARARGEDPGELLPGVHRIASLAKRWLLGTHQGSVDDAHLQSYLDEFRLPLQPPPLGQPRHAFLPRPRTRRRARSGALPRPGRQPAAEEVSTQTADGTWAPTQLGPAARRSAVACALTWDGPVS
jgi:transposase-like protein